MDKIYKIEVFLPKEALDKIRNGLYEFGFGRIGNYVDCMSWYEVNSSWKPVEGAEPYLGKLGEIEFATEYKLEFRCAEQDIEKAVKIIKSNHPYEEVCINIIPIMVY